MIAYKFLSPGAVGPFTGFAWPTPAAGAPGAWVEAPGALPETGVHACRGTDLPYWLDEELWVAELDGEVAAGERQLAAPRGRLLARVDGWDAEGRRAFGADCVHRLRARVVEALRAAGDAGVAEALSAAELAAIPAAARAAEAAARGDVAALAAFTGDAAGLVLAGNVASAAYVCARAAAVLDGPQGFGGERARQAGWLAARLGLDGLDGGGAAGA